MEERKNLHINELMASHRSAFEQIKGNGRSSASFVVKEKVADLRNPRSFSALVACLSFATKTDVAPPVPARPKEERLRRVLATETPAVAFSPPTRYRPPNSCEP